MEWLIDNWFWVLFGGLFIGMHLFGHGCHGGHGRHGGHGKGSGTKDRSADQKGPADEHSNHKH